MLMINAMKDFMAGVGRMRFGWRLWVVCLVVFNFVIPWFFISRFEAQLILVVGMLGAVIGLTLVKMQGFTRLLGLMHILWIPLVIYLWGQLDHIPATDLFGIWVHSLIGINTISLVIDVIDVTRYIAGDRASII